VQAAPASGATQSDADDEAPTEAETDSETTESDSEVGITDVVDEEESSPRLSPSSYRTAPRAAR
jgi:hypothetical protein